MGQRSCRIRVELGRTTVELVSNRFRIDVEQVSNQRRISELGKQKTRDTRSQALDMDENWSYRHGGRGEADLAVLLRGLLGPEIW